MERLEELKETINNEIQSEGKCAIKYKSIASCFPGEPHPLSLENRLIDTDSLVMWATEQGLVVSFDLGNECISYENMPLVFFKN